MQLTSATEVKEWITCLHMLSQNGICDDPGFLKPFHLLTLALTCRANAVKNLRLPEALQGYAARMHLWEAVGLAAPNAVNEWRPGGRFAEVQALVNANDVDTHVRALSEMIAVDSPGYETTESLEISLTELLNNCFEHSRSPLGFFGLSGGQRWPAGRLAQIAIADMGCGIRTTLEENPVLRESLEYGNACEIATNYGVTGMPHGNHSGYGLTVARDLLINNQGNLLLYSGHEVAAFRRSRVIRISDAPFWNGALIIFEWRTDRPLDIKQVYNSWPTPEGMNDDDLWF